MRTKVIGVDPSKCYRRNYTIMVEEAQLGMTIAKAKGQLYRYLHWQMLCETGRNICWRCNKPMSAATWSVDHITDWREHPEAIVVYMDPDNIKYSHKRCNRPRPKGSKARNIPGWRKEHGREVTRRT
jgi:hypothetical protein